MKLKSSIKTKFHPKPILNVSEIVLGSTSDNPIIEIKTYKGLDANPLQFDE